MRNSIHALPHVWRMDDVANQALGQALRKLGTERGWSPSDLGLRVDRGRNDLSLIGLGRSSPSGCMRKRRLGLSFLAKNGSSAFQSYVDSYDF